MNDREAGIMELSEKRYLGYIGAPVVIRNGLANAPAVSRWTFAWLQSRIGHIHATIKFGTVDKPELRNVKLRSFLEMITSGASAQEAGYLHDCPMLSVDQELIRDLYPFPVELISPWYQKDYVRFLRLFIGPAGTRTPLHFDRQETHNLFLQIRGTKRFTLCRRGDIPQSRFREWRWADTDLEACSTAVATAQMNISTIRLHAGDILYMPPRTPHQVFSETSGVSVNLDWHDRRSAVRSLSGLLRGMPTQDFVTNVRTSLGLFTGLPPAVVFPGKGPYLP